MGTYYSVVISKESCLVKFQDELKNKIDERLIKINQIFSTYIADSTISKFNRFKSKEAFLVEEEFSHLIMRALDITKKTAGAFNIFMDPLINLWGFDKDGRIEKRPKEEAIAQKLLMMKAGIEVRRGVLRKSTSDIAINLSAIAKGWAVDDISRLLLALGYQNHLVEIGGEVIARGEKSPGQPWVLGIEDPISKDKKILGSMILRDMALASSGTYLNYFLDNGVEYSHIIDPRSGYPIKRDLVSVSVLAKDCATADAFATAAMVMGEQDTKKVIELFSDLGFMFVYKNGHKSYLGKFDISP